MRVNGHNVLAIIVAAIAIYAIGFIIYGVLIPQEAYMAMAGITADEQAANMWKMALGPIMPILIAIGLSMVLKWRGQTGALNGVATAFWVTLFFVFASRLYSYVYSAENANLLTLDTAHIFATGLVAGAILGAWK